MITGFFTQPETYQCLCKDPMWYKVFAWLTQHPNPEPRDTPYSIDGDNISARAVEYIPEHPNDGKLETHDQYVDFHMPLDYFSERIMTALAPLLTVETTRPEDDLTFYNTPTETDLATMESMILTPKTFVIFDTIDAHMPQRIVNFKATRHRQNRQPHHKIVIKLRKSKLDPKVSLHT